MPKITAMKKNRSNLRSELSRNRLQDEHTDQAYDMVTGDNESQIQLSEFLMDDCHQEPSQSISRLFQRFA